MLYLSYFGQYDKPHCTDNPTLGIGNRPTGDMGRDQYEDNEMCFSSIFILLHFLRVKDDLNLLVRFVFKFTHMFNAHSAVKSSFHCLLISAKNAQNARYRAEFIFFAVS